MGGKEGEALRLGGLPKRLHAANDVLLRRAATAEIGHVCG